MTLPLNDRIAVVTGASRGIGRAVALELARAGAHVVALARTVGGLEELDDEIKVAGGSATLVPADIADFPALDRLGAALYERWGRLDILIGNAGILGALTPIGHVEPKVWDDVMAVNLTANWRLIRSLDPLLRAAPAGRAVFVTSGAATSAPAYWGPYSVSKAALEVLVRTWAAETSKLDLAVNLVNPGPIRTRMRKQAMPGEDPMSLPAPEDFAAALMELVADGLTWSGEIFDFHAGRLVLREHLG
jgi:NAD(P)-dependent dehydrogenase (short-subunit alcohol dehydrogenase family)